MAKAQKPKTNQTPVSQVPRLAAARFALSNTHPYFAKDLWALNPVMKPGLQEMAGGPIAVDKFWRLYYDPERISEIEVPILSNILIHEIMHLLRNHEERSKHILLANEAERLFEPQSLLMLLNICEDAEINDDIRADGLKLTEGCVYPEKLPSPCADNDMFENYFEKQKQLAQKMVAQGAKSGGEDGEEEAKGKFKIKVNGAGNGNDCGSCSHGQEREWEEPGNSSDYPAITKAEAEILRRETAKSVMEHAAKNRGTIPLGLAQWANEILNPKVDWRKELAAQVRHALLEVEGMTDYSWKKADRRSAAFAPKLPLPGLQQPVPDIFMILDTSGSMGGTENRVLGEIKGVLKAHGALAPVRISCVDAAIHSTQQVFNVKKVNLLGGGGTDMRLGFEHVQAAKPRPNICILITDGQTPWPSHDIGIRTICVLVGDHADENTPKWMRTVRVEE